jgi:hypothetical protein
MRRAASICKRPPQQQKSDLRISSETNWPNESRITFGDGESYCLFEQHDLGRRLFAEVRRTLRLRGCPLKVTASSRECG